MGVTGLGALIAIALAYMAQSPRLMARLGLAGARLDLRVREFTGYALALLLLAFGFFLAGVPLDTAVTAAVVTPTVTETSAAAVAAATGGAAGGEESTPPTPTFTSAAPQTPASGAFGGPPPGAESEETPQEETAPLSTPETPAAGETPAAPVPTTTATATTTPSPTSTPTNTPTVTPTPTLTPTPIEGETAVIQTGGSTLWVRRSPGGQQLSLVRNGDVVVLQSGHAHQGGILWQEVRTVDGVLGWVQEEFLIRDETS